MKKIIGIIFIALFALSSTGVMAAEKESVKNILEMSSSHKLTKSERTILENRVKEIRDMKTSSLTAMEKEKLRNELITIKEKLSEPFTGIYLSAGAIIIILLVLLILT